MEQSVLITRPDHDKVVCYLSCWAEGVINFAKAKGIKVILLDALRAEREYLESYLKKQNPRFIFLNGHGSSSAIAGQNDKNLIEARDNEQILQNRVVYALACHAANELGKIAVERGCTTFIGYEKEFAFVRSADRECAPQTDRMPEPFKIASNMVPLSLLKGNTTKESFDKSQRAFVSQIKKYATSDAHPENKEIRFWLFWDMHWQKLQGDNEAVILLHPAG